MQPEKKITSLSTCHDRIMNKTWEVQSIEVTHYVYGVLDHSSMMDCVLPHLQWIEQSSGLDWIQSDKKDYLEIQWRGHPHNTEYAFLLLKWLLDQQHIVYKLYRKETPMQYRLVTK